MRTTASLFTGGGGVDIGLMAAGYAMAWGIEYIPEIAAVAERNLGHTVIDADLLLLDPRGFEAVDWLHASPPCPNFSVAKANRSETEHDLALARKVAEFVTVLKPSVFSLENVWLYRKSRSWAVIANALHGAGYWFDVAHVNAADFGVPQTRKRMWVRARLGAMVPMLPPPEPWVGWYGAIEDLLDDLPESQFAPWQLARLPEELTTMVVPFVNADGTAHPRNSSEPIQTIQATAGKQMPRALLVTNQHSQPGGMGEPVNVEAEIPSPPITATIGGRFRALLVSQGISRDHNGREYGIPLRDGKVPAPTVTANNNQPGIRGLLMWSNGNTESWGRHHVEGEEPTLSVTAQTGGRARALLVDGHGSGKENRSTVRDGTSPSYTVPASPSAQTGSRALIHSRVVQMTPRCLARFQTFPDWYELPESKALASRIIGNAVPPLLAEKIARGMDSSKGEDN